MRSITLVFVTVLVSGVSPNQSAFSVVKDPSSLVVCLLIRAGVSSPTVPSDVFFVSSVWQGHYEHLGKRQPATLTVDFFNASSSKVNATFRTTAQVELKLTGRPGLS